MRLDTALENIGPPVLPPSPYFPPPLALPSLTCVERAGSWRVMEDVHFSSEGSTRRLQGTCCCCLHLQSHGGKVWECPGARAHRGCLVPGTDTGRIYNKTHLCLTKFQRGDNTGFEHGVDPWPSEMDIMNKPVGNIFFHGFKKNVIFLYWHLITDSVVM